MSGKITLPGLSQFSSLVDTNHVATDEQVSEINTLLGPHLQSLKSLEGELDKIGKIWADLSRQHASLLAEVNTVREIIAPMRRVPTDILQEIFRHCLPTKYNAIMSAEHCPLLLTRVCRSWRNIALATPSLWASLHIPVPSIPSKYFYGQYAFQDDQGEVTVAEAVGRRVTGMQEWLARSGTCALSLSLSEEDAGGFPRPEFIIPVFLSFSSRWKDLVVSAPLDRLSSLAAAVSDVPLLESLTLMRERHSRSSFHVEADSSIMWDTMDLLKAPRLRKVSFERLWRVPPPLPLRWSQLTSFTFKERYREISSTDGFPILTVARMLQPCVHLTDLHLEFCSHFNDLQPLSDEAEELRPPFMLSLPLIERLFIHDGGNDTRRMTIFFNALQAPSLRFLDISASPPLSFFSRTPRLGYLHLHLDQFTQDSLIQLLRHCQQLTSLVTSRSAIHWGAEEIPQSHIFDDNVLNLFVSPVDGDESSYFCPELEELECRSCAGFSDEGMVDFITRKRDGSVPGVAKLKRLHVAFDRTRRSWTGEQNERFVQDGLQLFVSHLDRDPIPQPTFPAVAGIRNYISWGQ
ncbi:hypothetical protein NLJ89_g3727 [Agrocybe chaxingu]|uniref:F-box domain-containing protein n=1 Tax=Agrocybe chaxingu TaxID=84603 RepID=A0A9W8MYD6_9AGAR|nr:hypothetical protein NLJ89_g3727 [Agrocybe chaxingu]